MNTDTEHKPISLCSHEHAMARIFNIQRYSLNDGHGIRTVIFFKGCPHQCPWCANPESISRNIQFVRRKNKCIHCKTCAQNVEDCPSGAFEQIGRDISLTELMTIIVKDDIFFRSSGGGVTLSGGEVLLQSRFASQLLKQLKQLGINTAIETAGDVRFAELLSVAQYCDEVLYDFKIMDPILAKVLINMRQTRVLDNFSQLYQHNIKLTPRLPLIPGYTLSEQNVTAILDFLEPLDGIETIHILPFHQYGQSKYSLIGKNYAMTSTPAPTEQQIIAIKALIEHRGYTVITGG